MAPIATPANCPATPDLLSDLKAKLVNGVVEVERDVRPTLADNYMYDFKYNHALPTLDILGADPLDVDPTAVADELKNRLEQVLSAGDARGFSDLFLDYGEIDLDRCRALLSLSRGLARQTGVYLGLSDVQLQEPHCSSCERPRSFHHL